MSAPGYWERAATEVIHKELDGLQADNAEHREQMSRLLKNWKSRATRAEAELAECKYELASLRNTLDELVAIQRERTEQAEAKCERLLKSLDYVIRDLEMRSNLKRGDEKGLVDIGDGAYRQAKAALAECGEG